MRKYLEALHALQLKAFNAGINMEFGVRDADTDAPWITGYIWLENVGFSTKKDFHFYDFEDEDRRGAELTEIEEYINSLMEQKDIMYKDNLVQEYLKKLQDLQASVLGKKVSVEIDTRSTDGRAWLCASAFVERENPDDEFVNIHSVFSTGANCLTADDYRKLFAERYAELEQFVEEHK